MRETREGPFNILTPGGSVRSMMGYDAVGVHIQRNYIIDKITFPLFSSLSFSFLFFSFLFFFVSFSSFFDFLYIYSHGARVDTAKCYSQESFRHLP